MAAPLQTQAEYAVSLHKHMPRGPAFPRELGTVQDLTLTGLANCFATLNLDANDLLIDAFPATAVQLLPEWEETCGTPGTGTTLEREAAVMAVLEAEGGSTVAFFRGLVLSYGFSKCTITQYTFSTVQSGVGQHLSSVQNPFYFMVNAWGAGDQLDMEAAVNRFKPAHTLAVFTYH
jgi:uncharacterized protein YmfQ (DUF2313 family)